MSRSVVFARKVSVVLAVMVAAVVASDADAQRTSRVGFTGQQLFEHQWKWTGPDSDETRHATRNRPRRVVRRSDGLGPLYNANSCVACHLDGGGSGIERNVTLITIDPLSGVVHDTKFGGRKLREVFPGAVSPTGMLIFNSMVHNESTRDGYAEIRERLADFVPGGIDNAWFIPERRTVAAVAQQPVVAGRHKSIDFYLSQRNSPPLYGLGIIDSINVERLREIAADQRARTDGQVTGRVAGKFGWQGHVATLTDFVVGACAGELGLNQTFKPRVGTQARDPADPAYTMSNSDMTSGEVMKLVRYIAELPRPVEQPIESHTLGQVIDGEKVFGEVGCADCHRADVDFVSGIFSDLLLHDMGPRLQAPSPAPTAELTNVELENTPRFTAQSVAPSTPSGGYYSGPNSMFPSALPLPRPPQPQFPRGDLTTDESAQVTWNSLQREWRTPPLWGVADSAPYLHDGRAATLQQAIEWHGGEADRSRQRFERLTRADKDLLLAFLSSLRAPVITASGDEDG